MLTRTEFFGGVYRIKDGFKPEGALTAFWEILCGIWGGAGLRLWPRLSKRGSETSPPRFDKRGYTTIKYPGQTKQKARLELLPASRDSNLPVAAERRIKGS
jgi:hypothetical protein